MDFKEYFVCSWYYEIADPMWARIFGALENKNLNVSDFSDHALVFSLRSVRTGLVAVFTDLLILGADFLTTVYFVAMNSGIHFS